MKTESLEIPSTNLLLWHRTKNGNIQHGTVIKLNKKLSIIAHMRSVCIHQCIIGWNSNIPTEDDRCFMFVIKIACKRCIRIWKVLLREHSSRIGMCICIRKRMFVFTFEIIYLCAEDNLVFVRFYGDSTTQIVRYFWCTFGLLSSVSQTIKWVGLLMFSFRFTIPDPHCRLTRCHMSYTIRSYASNIQTHSVETIKLRKIGKSANLNVLPTKNVSHFLLIIP